MAEIRQKIISCSQGHYYDANRYDSCPYCNSGSFSPTVDPFATPGPGRQPHGGPRGGRGSPGPELWGVQPYAAAPAARARFRRHGEDPVRGRLHPGRGPLPRWWDGW